MKQEIDEELRFHLEQQAAMESRGGLSPDEARRQARMAFGGVDVVKEASRDARGVRLLDVAVRDLEVSPVGQSYVTARANFEKLMAKVNQQISEGMEKGATSSIITLG